MSSKKNVLFLVHIEEMFRKWFPDEMYVNRLVKAHRSKKYDLIYHMVSSVESDEFIEELSYLPHERIDWGWGYEKDAGGYDECTCESYDHDPENPDCDQNKWLIESDGHECTWIPPEMRDFPWDQYNVFVGGGCDGECLGDLESILLHLNVNYKRVEGYIYG